MQLSAISLALTRAGFSAFTPKKLFTSGAQGAWYDPSDYSTMFEDAAGTIPITTPLEKPVGLMLDKSKGLVLGPELVTGDSSNFGGGTVGSWVSSGFFPATLSVVSGELEIAGASAVKRAILSVTGLTVGKTYLAQCVGRRNSASVPLLFALALDAGGSSNAAAQVITTSTVNVPLQFVFTAAGTSQFIVAGANTSGVAGDTYFIDNISVRELPGNHCYQSTTTSRPTLSARYNLLTKTEQFDDAAWFKSNSSVTANATTAPDGTLTADKLIPAAASVIGRTQQNYTGSAGTTYTLSVYAKQGEFSALRLYSDDNASNIASVYFNLISGAITTGPSVSGTWTGVSATSTPINAGWYRFTLTWTATGAAPVRVQFWNPNTGDGTSGIYIWGADLRVANDGIGLPAYQRVNTASDYDYAGFPPYLKFDGTDDSMATGNIDFTATDKMFVAAGVRKLSDAAAAIFIEFSSTIATNTGSFYVAAPENASGSYFSTGSRGSAGIIGAAYTTSSIYISPVSVVLSGVFNIATDGNVMRLNGAQAATYSGDQGTGNYGNYPLYIGRRGGTPLPFNGRLYSLVVCGKLASATEIASTEAYINNKTKAY